MRNFGSWFVTLAVLFAVNAAQADDATPPKGYRDTVRSALVEVREQNWPEAKALFERAHEMYPNARTLRGLGIVSFSARDYLDAIGFLTAALEHPVRPLTKEQRRQVEEMLDRSRAFIGYLELELTPDEADFLIDGEAPAVDDGDGKLALNPGEHQLVVRADGRREAVRTFRVEGGKTVTLRIQLEPLRQAVRAQVEREHAAEVAAQEPEPPASDDSGDASLRMPGLWTWVAGGAAAAFAIGAGVSYGLGVSEYEDLKQRCVEERCDGARKQQLIDESAIETKQTLANVGLALSVTALAGAVVIYVLEGDDSDSERSVALTAGPGQFGVSGTF